MKQANLEWILVRKVDCSYFEYSISKDNIVDSDEEATKVIMEDHQLQSEVRIFIVLK
jgi:hypothetical protein